jgi:hypothetical protein
VSETLKGRRAEILWVTVMAAAVALGGRLMLANLAHSRAVSAIAIAVILAASVVAMRRHRANGAPPIALTRDVTFIAAALLALAFVLHPARWSMGATIAAIEFGLILEMGALLTPVRQAGV